MRIAMLISGSLVKYDECLMKILNSSKDQIDLFISINDDEKGYYDVARSLLKKWLIVMNVKRYKLPDNFKNIQYFTRDINEDVSKDRFLNNSMSYFYNDYCAFNLATSYADANDFEYDVYLKFRSDIVVERLPEFDSRYKDGILFCVYTPGCGPIRVTDNPKGEYKDKLQYHYGDICWNGYCSTYDIAYGNRYLMKIYCDTYNFVLIKNEEFDGNFYICEDNTPVYNLVSNNIPYKYFKYGYTLHPLRYDMEKYDEIYLHPISFSINESKMIKYDDLITGKIKKKQIFAKTVPKCGYQFWHFESINDYYADYKSSLFAFTRKKAGWDCMRHYEIMANGCVPYFKNLDKAPKTSMTSIPKQLILDLMNLLDRENFNDNKVMIDDDPTEHVIKYIARDNNISDKFKPDFLNTYSSYLKQMMTHVHNNMTTRAEATRFLGVFKKEIRKVLVLTYNGRVDYLYNSLLIGLKEVLGIGCIEYPKVAAIYDDYPESQCNKLPGKGFSYSRILKSDLYTPITDMGVIEGINNHTFDLIINMYDCSEPNTESIKLVLNYALNFYHRKDISYVCGCDCDIIRLPDIFKDEHDCIFKKKTIDGHHVFIRELII